MDELTIIENKIYEIRGQRVMLDFDLAEMYGIETKNLNKAVKRNIERFPSDFMFQLTNTEAKVLINNLRFQNGTSNFLILVLLIESKNLLEIYPYSFS